MFEHLREVPFSPRMSLEEALAVPLDGENAWDVAHALVVNPNSHAQREHQIVQRLDDVADNFLPAGSTLH